MACWSRRPYIKLLAMVYCWVAPCVAPSDATTRGRVLWWVDALGKWSLIDIYVMAMMMVAFRFHIEGTLPADNPDPADPGVVDVKSQLDIYVEANSGFYAFLLATMWSLVQSHIMLLYHRRDVNARVRELGGHAALDGRASVQGLAGRGGAGAMWLSWRAARVAWTRLGAKARSRQWLGVTALLAGAWVLNLAGILTKSFNFEFKGLAGLALGEGERVRP